MSTLVDASITTRWWEELLKDECRMNNWLLKLQQTELDGYIGNIAADGKWNTAPDLTIRKVLKATANDEQRHSDLLVKLIRDRGLEPYQYESGVSGYWSDMDAAITDIKSFCAVCHIGERLAAERFEILLKHSDTPRDIKIFLEKALPDESYHATAFLACAGEVEIEKAMIVHNIAMQRLLKNRKVK
jgi:hypothetical protein